jgi:two-component system, LytTR family, sensor histidine kinase LytS
VRDLLRSSVSSTVLLLSLAPALLALVVLAAFDRLLTPAGLLVFIASYAVFAFTLAAAMNFYGRRLEHGRAVQSDRVLSITNDTLPHLKTGLSRETASAVAGIVKAGTDALAVAITDKRTVLGFAGAGEDHHVVGKPVLTKATRDALAANETQIVGERAEIGCPVPTCPLAAAIVVPLEQKGEAIGSLKFYYDDSSKLTESRIALAEGLALLLSTQLELSEIEKQRELASTAELKALQAQINPHFLFNTLNTIAMLTRTDPVRARHLLIEFAHFFRQTLEHADDTVPLARELDYIHSYLVFERARFGDKLRIDEEVDPDLEYVVIPAFTVQPLVENAVKHGTKADGTLSVGISVTRGGDVATICVQDNGIGIPARDLGHVTEPGFGKGIGIGLSNVDQRLRGMFGEQAGLRIESTTGQGTEVRFSVPLEERR